MGMLRAASSAACPHISRSRGSVKRPLDTYQNAAATLIMSRPSKKMAAGWWKLRVRNSMMCCDWYGSDTYCHTCTCKR